MDTQDLTRLVDEADDAALLRAVDALAASRDWDLMETLGERCRQAVEMGRQLWGVAMHIDYRLAWEGSAVHAAHAVARGSSRFTLGPLTEVAAGSHAWDKLGPHLTDPASRTAVAQERVLRGEDLRAVSDVAALAGVPLWLAAWEPTYALPAYRDRKAAFPEPDIAIQTVPLDRAPMSDTAEAFDDEATVALKDVVRSWWAHSSGVGEVVAIEGDAALAVATVRRGRPGQWGLREISATEGLAMLQWAGASGGAYAPRPGGAAGRFAAWWAATALAGLDWPEATDSEFADELGAALAELRWYRWAGEEPDTGWTLRLAIEDPTDQLAWAIEALDQFDDEDDQADESP